jgi:polar amino acid transport system permease protein
MMRWDWLPEYFPLLMHGLYLTLVLLVVSVVLGFILAVPIGLVQVTGPTPLRYLARGFCTFIRGTPLLIQLWLLYYGIGSLFPTIGLMFPGFKENFMWLIRLDAYYYAIVAFTLSYAGYEGEVMRGAFLGVPRGELEAARAFGMSPWKVLSRVWLPRAVRQVLPTLAGETIDQLKSTPIAFTIPVMELMGVTSRIRQDTYLTYEPLLFLALVYLILTFIITRVFLRVESQIPTRR